MLLFPISTYTQPIITGVSQNVVQNIDSIIIIGGDFGVKPQAAPLISSYDNPIAENNWSTGIIGGNWTTGGTLILTNISPRASFPQSIYKISYDAFYPPYESIRFNHPVAEDKLYISFWMYRDHPTLNMTTGGGNNSKFLRIYQSSSTSDGNIIYSLGCDDNGDPLMLYAGGDNMALCPDWEIAYTACNAGKYSSPMFSPFTADTLPLMQIWEHYEYYIDYPSNLGGTDGIHVMWKDGITLARSINIAVNQTGQTNNRRWILIGQVSGGRTVHYNEYIDQVYIDNTQAHIFISSNSNVSWSDYDLTRHDEIQVASIWLDTSIIITVNQGSFQDGDTAYIYVVNENGNISNGYQIVFSGSGIVNNNIKVYPNPCKVYMGHNSITFNNLSSNDAIKIFDISGKLIHNSGNIANNKYRWSVNNVSSGIYFYKVGVSNKVIGKIVIIE